MWQGCSISRVPVTPVLTLVLPAITVTTIVPVVIVRIYSSTILARPNVLSTLSYRITSVIPASILVKLASHRLAVSPVS